MTIAHFTPRRTYSMVTSITENGVNTPKATVGGDEITGATNDALSVEAGSKKVTYAEGIEDVVRQAVDAAAVATVAAQEAIAASRRTTIVMTTDLSARDALLNNSLFLVQPAAGEQLVLTLPEEGDAGFHDGYEIVIKLDAPGAVLVRLPDASATTLNGQMSMAVDEVGDTITLASSVGHGWQLVNAREDDILGTGSNLFLTNAADGTIPGYLALTDDDTDVRYDDPGVTFTPAELLETHVDVANAVTIGTWISDAGAVSRFIEGDLALTMVANITPANAALVQLVGELYKRESNGTETLIKTSLPSTLIGAAVAQHTVLIDAITENFAATDRLVLVVKAFMPEPTGVLPTLQVSLGGLGALDFPARLIAPSAVTANHLKATRPAILKAGFYTTPVPMAIVGGHIKPDLNKGNVFTVLVTEPITLDFPDDVAGKAGMFLIYATQDEVGGHDLYTAVGYHPNGGEWSRTPNLTNLIWNSSDGSGTALDITIAQRG
jgi:hypothetical protein